MHKITMRGQEYPIHLGIGTIAEIQERYGEVGNLPEALSQAKEIPWIFAVLINDGLRVQAFELGQPAKQISVEDVAVLLEIKDTNNQKNIDAIVACINESMGAESKNLTAGDLTQMTSGMNTGTETPAKE